MTQLTRRDFLRLCGTSSIGLALAACGLIMPTPTAMPTPTSMPLPTNTLLPTATPTQDTLPTNTLMPTPTATNTLMPTHTSTPKPEITLTPMKLYKAFDLSGGIENSGFTPIDSSFRNENSNFEVIYQQGRGYVIHGFVKGTPPAKAMTKGGAHRGYAEYWSEDFTLGDWAWEFMINVRTDEILTNSGSGTASWYSGGTIGVPCKDGQVHMAAGFKVITTGREAYLQLYVIDKNDKSIPVVIAAPPKFNLGEDTRVRFEVYNDNGVPKVRFFQNDRFHSGAELRDDALVAIGIVRGGGIYAGASVRKLDSWAWDLKLFRK